MESEKLMPMTTSEPTTGNVIQHTEGRPTLIEAAKAARDAADEILNRGEPTTGNIAKALRVCFEKTCACSECPFEHESCGDIEQLAADRLESQEREIERLKEELEQMEEAATVLHAANETHWTYIKELTARAEKAERERDAAKAYMKRFGCLTCNGQGTLALNHTCGSCRDKSKWEMRGLPQEGEGA